MPCWALAAGSWLGFILAGAANGQGAAKDQDTIQQDVKYIWPITLWSVPLTPYPGGNGKGLEDASLASRLAALGEKAFDKYVQSVLPHELKADPQFAAEFASGDASRTNSGFLRWQQRVFADLRRVPIEELSWDGRPIPKHPEVEYTWPELYDSPEYKRLRRQIQRLSGMYLAYLGKQEQGEKPRFRVFIWAEVFRFADSHRPLAYTGSTTVGTFFARYQSDRKGAQKYAFEDPRGINPPFGKTHNHQPRQGEVVMYPSWASHFITPQPRNSTNVFFHFATWPPEGPRDFDWEDDATGDYNYRKQFHIKRPKTAGQDVPAAGNVRQKTEL